MTSTKGHLLSLGANALAATILGFAISYGLKFTRAVHVDEKGARPGENLHCQYIGDCYGVDVDHCFFSSHVMILALAVGGILVADFTLWAYAQGATSTTQHRQDTQARSRRLAFTRLISWVARRDGKAQEEDNEGGRSWTLLVTLVGALASASAIALFAPHRETLIIKDPVSSYPTTDYASKALWPSIDKDHLTSAMSEVLIQSAAIARHVAIDGEEMRQHYDRVSVDEKQVVRIGDALFSGPRTLGVGLNIASFNEDTLSKYSRDTRLRSSSDWRQQRRTWTVAPDYKPQSLWSTVYGTNVSAKCEDVTSRYTMERLRTGFSDGRRTEVTQFDIVDANFLLSASVLHQRYDWRRLTFDFNSPSTDNSQYVFLTDDQTNPSSPRFRGQREAGWAVTVLRCEYQGNEIMANVIDDFGTDPKVTSENLQKVAPLTDNALQATKWGVRTTLERYGSQALLNVLREVRFRQDKVHQSGVTRDGDFDQGIIEDTLTDLAQAYWTLVRQQVETPAGLSVFENKPQVSSGLERGQLRGTYTRLGGAGWGLIMPGLLLILPTIALSRSVLCLVLDWLHARDGSDKGWELLLQDEEVDDEEADSFRPPPPPKDDEPPPPPYTAQ